LIGGIGESHSIDRDADEPEPGSEQLTKLQWGIVDGDFNGFLCGDRNRSEQGDLVGSF
jgi:hypothetical protein